jgi:xylulokinase
VSIYVGFDSSTQSLTATVIAIDRARRSVVTTRTFRFDDVLPKYRTRFGVLPSHDDTSGDYKNGDYKNVVHAPPLMWAEALETMFGELTQDRSVDWSQLRAISGSAQQHGSVYLNALAAGRLARLEPGQSLAPQLLETLSRVR